MSQRRARVGRDNEPIPDAEPTGVEAEAAEAVDGCGCPVLDPGDWDGVESDWSDIAFLRLSLPSVLGVPMGYMGVLERARVAAETRGVALAEDAMVLLGQGRFRRPVLVEVEAEAGQGGLERPGGVAFSVLAEAPFGDMKKRFEEARAAAAERFGRNPDAMWVWYLTCKSCSAERRFETLFVAHYRR